jgi:hypothetical protein
LSVAADVRRAFVVVRCIGANERDRLVIEPSELVADIGERRFRALCREFGWQDLAGHYAPTKADRQSGVGQARCQWQGGYCMTIVSGRYCSEHEQLGEITYRAA